MKYIFFSLIFFNFSYEVTFGQWENVTIIGADSMPKMCPISPFNYPISLSCIFLTPASIFCWAYRDGCTTTPHVLEAGGYFNSVDSCKTWYNNMFVGGYGTPSNAYNNFAFYGDTIFRATFNGYGSSFRRSVNNGINWNGYFLYQNYIYAPRLLSVYNGRYGYGSNVDNMGFSLIYRIENDSCYPIINFNRPISVGIFKFLDDSIGFMGSSDTLLRTSNGGASWDTVLVDTSSNFNRFLFFNDSIGIICKYNGSNYKTMDKGLTWQPLSPAFYFPPRFCYLGPDTLFSFYTPPYNTYDTNFTSVILRSVNGGLDWDSVNFIQGYDIKDIKMFNYQFGYIHAIRKSFTNYIFRTFNGIETKIELPAVITSNVFPNPFIDNFNVVGERINQIMIFDSLGKIVYSERLNDLDQKLIVPNLRAGIYFLNFSNDKYSETIKLICIN